MPVPVQPDAMQEGFAAAAQPDPLDPEQHFPGAIAVGPLGGGPAVQRRRLGIGGRLLGHPPGLAVSAGGPAGTGALVIRHQAKEGLHLPGGLHKAPALPAQQQVDAGASAAALVLAAALVAEPGATAVLVVKAVAIRPAAERAGLMAIAELLAAQSRQGSQDLRPAAPGRSNGIRGHGFRLTCSLLRSRRDSVMPDPVCPAGVRGPWRHPAPAAVPPSD